MLVSQGIFEEHPYGPSKTRNEYRLAQAGRDIFPIVVALLQWGDKYLTGSHGRSIVLQHTRCGGDADPQLVCQSCHEPIELSEVVPTPGQGASEWVREHLSQLSGSAFSEPDGTPVAPTAG
jgi:hypothetical protein